MKSPTRCELHTGYGVEVCDDDGPSGCFREAIEVAVHDWGGNEHWRGKPGDQPKFNIQTRLVATKLGEWIAGYDTLCDYAASD